MRLRALAYFAVLAAFVPGASSAKPIATAGRPVQTFERLALRGYTALQLGTNAPNASAEGNAEISKAHDYRQADIRRPMRFLSGFARAAVNVPEPRGEAVVPPEADFFGFAGLTHYDQRTAGTGPYVNTQYSLEPPDQGLCVGNGFVMEVVNDALAVYDTKGTRLAGPVANNQFFRLAPEIVRPSGPYGPSIGDPRCYFDRDTQRWLVTVYEQDVDPSKTAVLLAVSQTANPLGAYSVLSIDTADKSHPGCPCFPDQPLIGADANGFYISTNEFPSLTSGFNGSQVYALSKRALAAGILPTVVHIDAGAIATPDPGGTWYSIQPAASPRGGEHSGVRGGTEFFLSALDFFNANDDRVAVWALTNTAALGERAPRVTFRYVVVRGAPYAGPIPAVQKAGPAPLAASLGAPLPLLDTNDDRMNQVVYADGKLWSGVNTAVRFHGATYTGIDYFVVAPRVSEYAQFSATMANSGYVAVRDQNVIFPSVGVNERGKAIVAFTLVGPSYYPSAAYAPLAAGAGNVRLAGAGQLPDDGFTAYAAYGGSGVGRWGDYTAAVADADGNLWFAAEYIPDGPRTVLANWGTFIGRVRER